MSEWSVLGLFILLFAPALGRLSTIAGLITIVAGITVIAMLSGNLTGALGVAAVTCFATSYVYSKKTGEMVVTDWLMHIAGIVSGVLAFVFAA